MSHESEANQRPVEIWVTIRLEAHQTSESLKFVCFHMGLPKIVHGLLKIVKMDFPGWSLLPECGQYPTVLCSGL